MKKSEVEPFMLSLEAEHEILKKFWPPGMVDFRNGVPVDFQSGMFMKLARLESDLPTRDPDVNLTGDCTCKYGSEAKAKLAVEALASHGIAASIEPPHIEILESDGEEFKTRTQFWTVRFTVTEELLV